jgi:hypothetical protein
MRNKLLVSIIFLVLALIFIRTYLSVHESVHASILTSYNIKSITKSTWFSARTYPANETEYQEKCTAECHLANNITDIVGYHVTVVIFCLFAIAYLREIMKGLGEINIKIREEIKEDPEEPHPEPSEPPDEELENPEKES